MGKCVRYWSYRYKCWDNTNLRTKLDTLIGKDKYRISIDPINCHVIFNLELSAQNLKNAVAELLEKVLPLNLTYEINLAYNKHADLASYQHKELNNYTHKELNAKKLRWLNVNKIRKL